MDRKSALFSARVFGGLGSIATAFGLIGFGIALGKGDKILYSIPLVMLPVAFGCFRQMLRDGALARTLIVHPLHPVPTIDLQVKEKPEPNSSIGTYDRHGRMTPL